VSPALSLSASGAPGSPGCWRAGERLWLAAGLVAVVLLTYQGALRVPLSSDARFLTYQNELVRAPDGLFHFWTRDVFEGAETHGTTYRSGYYRPVLNSFFWIEYRWAGTRDALYNLSEVVLHGLNAFLVLLLVTGLTRSRTAGLVAGALFAVHPVNAFAASEPAARGDLLFATFYLLALLVFQRALEREGRLPWAHLAGVSGLYALSLLSKEMGVTLPATLVLLVVLAHARSGGPLSRITWTAPAWALLAVYLAWRFLILDLDPGRMGYADAHGRVALLVATLKTLPVHVVRLAAPLSPGYPELNPELVVVVGRGVGDPLLWLALALGASLCAAVWAWRGMPGPAFWAAFFVVTYSPLLRTENIAGTLDTSVILTQERWIYLPAVAFFAVVGMVVARVGERTRRRWTVPVGVAALATLLAWESSVHAGKHEDPFARLRRLYAIPEVHLSRFELANRALLYAHWVALRAGDVQEAEERARTAVGLVPDSPITAHGLADILARRGRWPEVRALLQPWMAPTPEFLAATRASNFRVYDDWNRINPEVALLLGRAQGWLGELAEARRLLCEAGGRGVAPERVADAVREIPALAGSLTCGPEPPDPPGG